MSLQRTPLRTELELRRLDSELTRLREDLSKKTKGPEILHNPTWLAILGAIVTVGTGIWQLHAGRELEREKLRSTLIQEASKSANAETTLKNLKFLVKAGLIVDEQGAIATLKLDDVPSFAQPPITALTQSEMIENFGDPKLGPREGRLGFAEPNEAWIKKNLVEVEIPALHGVRGFPLSGKIRLHRKAAPHFQEAIAEISQKGMLKNIKSFNGSWVPRMNGGTSNYSTHAFGIAIDINVEQNPFGRKPASAEQEGSTAELVPIFERHGFYWGGHFLMPEGGHFQYGVKLLALIEI